MKKSFLMFGVAAMALASCTQNEVVEYAENRAIQFDTFVNNNTRAVTELKTENLTKFNVFAYHGTNTVDYNNVLVTGNSTSGWTPAANAYWQADNAYEFAAYSDQNGELSNVSFANKTLTFTGYEVAGKDLVAAQTSVDAQDNVNKYTAVNLNFYHMLSQIKFTFTNSDAADYTLKISNIKITAGKTATGTFTMTALSTPSITWNATDSNNGEYTIAEIADIAKGANQTTESESLLILPQNTDNLKVTFTATLTDAGGAKIAEGNFEAPLDIDRGVQTSNWMPGYRYNYTATLNGDNVPVDPENPDVKPKKIEFNVTVDEWENSTPDTDPTTPVIPEP
ncbi:fimbrillin family protein [Phocaeicola plebeius]|uniref:fimbrillin family protein n=1 Tax=Phocaeicola plebeius TaxID=310297 RepID=UPI0026F2FABF|nr:fimbrillin family protein [Phocaeicola plebeius]